MDIFSEIGIGEVYLLSYIAYMIVISRICGWIPTKLVGEWVWYSRTNGE